MNRYNRISRSAALKESNPTLTGSFKISRSIMKSCIADPSHPELIYRLLILASITPCSDRTVPIGNETVKLEAGQLLTSSRALSEAWGGEKHAPEYAVRKTLKIFEQEGVISTFKCHKYTIITFIGWEDGVGSKISNDSSAESEKMGVRFFR